MTGAARVVHHGPGEMRRAPAGAEFRADILDDADRRVEHPVGPALWHARLPGVHDLGIQQRHGPAAGPEQAAAMWYRRMSRALARRGVEKPAAQTPHEFVKKIKDSRLREPVARFTDAYESARFGDSAEDVKRLPELYEEVESATRTR